MTENFDFGTALENSLANESLSSLISCRNNLSKYLLPPYTWSLPDPQISRLELHEIDPKYHYVFRNNTRTDIINHMTKTLKNSLLSEPQKSTIKKSIEKISAMDRNSLRTESDMNTIRRSLEEVLEVLNGF